MIYMMLTCLSCLLVCSLIDYNEIMKFLCRQLTIDVSWNIMEAFIELQSFLTDTKRSLIILDDLTRDTKKFFVLCECFHFSKALFHVHSN
jgi:hypothetical protein